MTVAEVIRAAMGLTPEERAQVADALYGIDAADQSEIDAAWASVCAERLDQIERGAARTFTRSEADEYLDSRAAARGA